MQDSHHRVMKCTDNPFTESEKAFIASAKGIYGSYVCVCIYTQVKNKIETKHH